MLLKTFTKGGIHPPEYKISSGKEIEKLPVPENVTIPVSQHIGAPSKVLVKRGDAVKTGQLIAESTGFVSANTHSSVTGTVVKIDSVTDTSGYRRPAVVIKTEEDEWTDGVDLSADLKKECQLEKDEIIRKILEAGIVGLGGATFPSHVKLSVPKGKKAEYLILNGVECEPYLTADHALMLEKGEEILAGARILMKAMGVEKCIIGIENNKPDAIAHLSTLAVDDKGVEIQALKVKYPQGGEKQLVKALLNRSVPAGGLPIDVGVVVFNVGSVFAVYEAVQKNKPLIERVVTVTGKSVSKPSNFLVRIGTPVSALIDAAGGLPEDTGKVVSGGPMMGKALHSLDIPVMKGSSGVLIIPEEASGRNAVRACIRCTKCVNVCPMGLEPYLLMTEVQKDKYDMAEQDRVMDCIECGSCSYICPSNRPLLDYIRLGKVTVGKIIRSRK
jgi:electron transport complex protein RnfC